MNTISKSNGIFTLNVKIYFADRSCNKMQRYGSFLSAYKQNFAENESLILLTVGDIITVYYEDSEETIKEMISYK